MTAEGLPADWREHIGSDGLAMVVAMRGAGKDWEEIDMALLDRYDGGDYTKGISPVIDPDSVPQTDRILGDANRALVLLNQRIESARTALADLEKQREAYLQELRTLGGSGEGRKDGGG